MLDQLADIASNIPVSEGTRVDRQVLLQFVVKY
jgi:hypothetical protein